MMDSDDEEEEYGDKEGTLVECVRCEVVQPFSVRLGAYTSRQLRYKLKSWICFDCAVNDELEEDDYFIAAESSPTVAARVYQAVQDAVHSEGQGGTTGEEFISRAIVHAAPWRSHTTWPPKHLDRPGGR